MSRLDPFDSTLPPRVSFVADNGIYIVSFVPCSEGLCLVAIHILITKHIFMLSSSRASRLISSSSSSSSFRFLASKGAPRPTHHHHPSIMSHNNNQNEGKVTATQADIDARQEELDTELQEVCRLFFFLRYIRREREKKNPLFYLVSMTNIFTTFCDITRERKMNTYNY